MSTASTFFQFYILVAIAALILLIDGALFFAWLLRKDEMDAGTKPPIFAPVWSLVDVWVAVQIILVAFLGLALVSLLACMNFGWLTTFDLTGIMDGSASDAGVLFVLGTVLVQNGVVLLVSWSFIHFRYRMALRQIGLPALPTRRQLFIGLSAGLVMVLASTVFETAMDWVLRHLLTMHTYRMLAEMSKAMSAGALAESLRHKPTLYALLFFGGAVCAPVGEEFFFRGFLYNCVKHRIGVTAAVLISAFFFALAHGGPLLVLAILPIGAMLALMYERTGSLWVTIIMHMVNNAIGFLWVYYS